MLGKNSILSGGRELVRLTQQDSFNGALIQRIINAVNTMATNIGVSTVGKLPPPPPIDSIQVNGTQTGSTLTCPSEILHWTLTHNQSVQKGIQYITEIANEPNFLQPHVYDHGCSRTGFLNLSSLDNNGQAVTYYMRSYAQYHGSDAQKPTVFGGFNSATGIKMTGLSMNTLLASTGSGTAGANGQQGGKGLGSVLVRSAPGPKRNTA